MPFRSKNSFAKTHPHLKEFTDFLVLFNKESDRGGVLIATSMLDNLLEKIISSYLVDTPESSKLLEGFNAPIGTLSSRVLCAYALGLLSEKEYRECEQLRKIRNDFAHHVHASYNDQSIVDRCKNLTYSVQETDPSAKGYARSLFITSAVSLILNLTNRAAYAKKKRLKYADWPY